MTAKTPAERQRAYRVRNGAGDTPGPPRLSDCGSVAGYRVHKRHHETPCAACRTAWNLYHRDLYKAKHSA